MPANKSVEAAFPVDRRLRSHKLGSPTFQQPAEVVRWFGAVQAQDFHGAKWAVALRMRDGSHAAVEAAFNRGEVLRTHLLRPTWHFVAREDIRWLLQLTAPRINVRCGPNYRKFELDAGVFKRSHRMLVNALKGGKHLTRSVLKAELNRAGITADDTVRMAHILIRAELDGVVCSGPRDGKQFTYALLEERVPAASMLTRDEALAELTRRYFTSHGPATLADYVWWSGLTTNDARRGIALVERDLDKVTVKETVYWTGAAPVPAGKSVHTAHLLPAFDEYNVAYKDRQVVIDAASGLTTGDVLGPVVMVDGKIVGTWKSSTEITVNLGRSLSQEEKTRRDKSRATLCRLSRSIARGRAEPVFCDGSRLAETFQRQRQTAVRLRRNAVRECCSDEVDDTSSSI